MRRAIPWLGLLLLAISFVWFVRGTGSTQPLSVTHESAALGERNKRSPVVVLDPGHGGADSGAICGAIMEKDLTLDVALRAELLLRTTGYAPVLTRDSDRYVSLADRAAVGNHADDSLFISIHFNDGERPAASGVETYYPLRQSTGRGGLFSWWPFLQRPASAPLAAKDESLARFVQAALVERTGAANRGIKSERFYVIANVHNPAALVEGGFMTNKSDVTKLTTTEYRQQIAIAISDGVHRHLEATRRVEPTLALAEARPE